MSQPVPSETGTAAWSFDDLVALLRCPVCAEPLAFTPTGQPSGAGHAYGVLACSCSRYPVIDDIPILRHDAVAVQAHVSGKAHLEGPTPASLIRKIEAGRGREALLDLIAFPYFPPGIEPSFRRRRLAQREPLLSAGLAWRRAALRRMLDRRDELSVEEWLRLFYQRSAIPGNFPYFFYRFAQPRSLSGLSLMTLFPRSDKPILDLATGFGHLPHFLTRGRGQRVIGADRNFYHIWVARHWLVPGAHFLCADADKPLPFHDGALSGALCADAFHLFDDKEGCVAELRRTTADGTLILARVGNELLEPNEGRELTPEGYAALVGDLPYRLVGEAPLIERYLERLGPALAAPTPPHTLDGTKWITLVASRDPEVLADHGRFEAWPHAAGRLGINPIYRRTPRGDGLELEFRFPTAHYERENRDMLRFHPAKAALDGATLREVAAGERTPRVEARIDDFVVIGMPDRYLADRPAR